MDASQIVVAGETDSLARAALRWLDVIVCLALVVAAVLYGPRGSPWYVGLCLAAVSTPFWLAAKWQLGEAFSVRPEARRLVTRGLYAKLRHPVYVFGGLAFMSALLALLGWGALTIWAVVAVVELRRARREERVLADRFGAEYEAYRESTWF
jgi:protein-S-isoprenylcysteine O-methyltransferase Ste14